MQVMSVWPFKQMILKAQLKQSPIPTAQFQGQDLVDRGRNQGSTSASSSSSSSQSATINMPRDLVQQKLSGSGSSVQSDAQPASKSSAESAAASSVELDQAQAVLRGHEDPGSHAADVQNSSIQGSPGEPLQTDYLFHFGDTTDIRKALEMPNRLTG